MFSSVYFGLKADDGVKSGSKLNVAVSTAKRGVLQQSGSDPSLCTQIHPLHCLGRDTDGSSRGAPALASSGGEGRGTERRGGASFVTVKVFAPGGCNHHCPLFCDRAEREAAEVKGCYTGKAITLRVEQLAEFGGQERGAAEHNGAYL